MNYALAMAALPGAVILAWGVYAFCRRRPRRPRRVRLKSVHRFKSGYVVQYAIPQAIKGGILVPDVQLSWQRSPDTVTAYTLAWTLDGNPAATVNVPQSGSGDTGGYSSLFTAGNPGVTLKAGDTVGCTLTCTGATGTSSPVTPSPVTIPTPPAPPQPPQNVALAVV